MLENGTDEELRKRGLVKPAIAVIDGMRKPWRTTLRASHYRDVKKLGEDQLLVVAPPRRLRPRAPGVDETLNQQLAAPTPSLA